MKNGKILIPAVVIISILVALLPSAAAVEENETITDSIGDVIDHLGEVVESHSNIDVENIDIINFVYERSDKDVTFELKVDGIIEDRGDITDFSFLGFGSEYPEDVLEFDMDTVGYTFILSTTYEDYQIVYVNNRCQIMYSSTFDVENISEDDFSVSGDTLTVSFELNTSNETYDIISAQTNYMRLKFDLSQLENMTDEEIEGLEDLMTILTDEAPNQPLQVYAEATNLGEVGVDVEFEGFAIYGQPPHSYKWDFGDGTTSTEKSPKHTYDSAGNYNYTLTVTDSSGASERDTGQIEIIDTDGDENGTPGFELVLLIAAFALIVLWKRR